MSIPTLPPSEDPLAERQHALILATANQVALNILTQETGVAALRHIAEAARALVSARYAALGVARMDGEGLQEFISVGLTPEEEVAIASRPSGRGILGLLLTRSEPLRISQLTTHAQAVGFPPGHPPMYRFLGVPIRRGETVLGSLYLTDKEDGAEFTEADAVAIMALSDYAAVAIHYLRLFSRQRALLAELISAQEEERRAIAYDLHDGLTQYVMAAYAHLEAFHAERDAEQAIPSENLVQARVYLKEAVVESRRLVNGLRALALDDLGLAGALEQLLAEEKQRAGWTETEFTHNIAGRRYDRTLETTVYRVAQEALTNIRKHAGIAPVRLTLLEAPLQGSPRTRLTLEVRDWGRGFPVEPRTGEGMSLGFGLQSMKERVLLLDGKWQLHSAPGQGTRIQATFLVLPPTPEEESRL